MLSAMVLVFYSVLVDAVLPHQLSNWQAELPMAKRDELLRVRHHESRISSLLGYQLLKHACAELGAAPCRLAQLVFAKGKKPVFPHGIHFSLSHSHRLVACAVSAEAPLGLDTEYVRRIDGPQLANTLSDTERSAIAKRKRSFFDIWTGKEAIVKAHGRSGLQQMKHIDLGHHTGNNAVLFDNQQWYLTQLRLQPGYVTHLATRQSNPGIHQKMIQSREL